MHARIAALTIATCLGACAPRALPDDVDVHARPSEIWRADQARQRIPIPADSPLAPYQTPQRILIEPHQEDCRDKTIVIGEHDNEADNPQQRERVVTMTCEDEPGKAPYHEVLPAQPAPQQHHPAPGPRRGKAS